MCNNKKRTAKYLDFGAFSTIWSVGDRVLKITQDTTTIDFYESIIHTGNQLGLPDVVSMSSEEMEELYFDYKAMTGTVFPDTGNLVDEIARICEYTNVFLFLNDPALLQNFKGYTMPKYAPLHADIKNKIDQWRDAAYTVNVDPYCSTEQDLDFVIHLFKKLIPVEYYYPESMDTIVQYLKARDNWCLDPNGDNFMLDENGKIVFTDIFSGGHLGSVKLKNEIQQNLDRQSVPFQLSLSRAKIRM